MRYDDPTLRDRLAGEYVLGTMPSRARRRFERLMRDDATLTALVGAWESRLAPLDEATEPVAPPERVWRAIDRRVEPVTAPRRRVGGLWFWRGLAGGALAACAALALYITLAPAPPAPTVVAVLADDRGQLSWIALRRPGSVEIGIAPIRDLTPDPHHSFQLWGLAGGTPKPLGLLGTAPGKPLMVSAADVPAPGGALAISREPPGGSPTGTPTGPVLYQGKVLPPP
jgi:anti-sigma-K factor RskA